MPRCHQRASSMRIATPWRLAHWAAMAIDLELRVMWQTHIGISVEAEHWFDSTLAMHRQPGRHYHDVRHVGWVVRHVVEIGNRCAVDDLASIVAAGFFHDAVYDPTRHDNEQQSAALASRALSEIGWDAARCGGVSAMVLATATHDVESASLDTAVLLAADLAVLASEPARYHDYALAVRKEYAHVSDDDWRNGRSAVLQRLLGRAHLFAPALRLDEWETRARANLTAELATLR